MNEQPVASALVQRKFCDDLKALLNQAGKDGVPIGLAVSEMETVKTFILFNHYSQQQFEAMQKQAEAQKAESASN